MKYIIDTDTISYYMKEKKNVANKIEKNPPSDYALSMITVAEIYYGIKKSNNKKIATRFNAIVEDITLIEFSQQDAISYGEIRSELESSGKIIGPNDMLIASQALSRGLTLITNNTREFGRIKKLKVVNFIS